MALLRDDPEFEDAIRGAARELGELDPSFVEKDYWVTQVLRALHAEFPHGFVFKGGTSLSKGYSIIERFSEDVDILVVPLREASIKQREDHLRAIAGAVGGYLNLEWEGARAPGRGRDATRGDYLRYRQRIEGAVRTGVGAGLVLLETGYGGGTEPSEMVEITPLMCAPLGIDPAEYEDTQMFRLRALEPRRTLIEKLFAVHHIATLGPDRVPDENRFGRHFYDILRLLEYGPVLDRLRRNRADFDHIVAEVERLSAIHFGGTTNRPETGFASSSAFSPDRDSDLRRWLEERYGDALGLLPRQARQPQFGEVVKRVHECADLL